MTNKNYRCTIILKHLVFKLYFQEDQQMGITIKGFRIGHESSDGWHVGPNSAGGVSVEGTLVNNSEKIIKYILIYFTPYNAVNDPVECSIKHVSNYGIRITGPINPHGSSGFLGENLWYNNSISMVVITSANIEYMDGSKETIQGSDITLAPADSGCYVATAVYGSYDCPQVWTLRRYRDYTLAKTWYGRAFIRTYYAISPTIVKCFGHTEWFSKMWKGKLDRMVSELNEKGVEDTPYIDKQW